GLSHPPNPPAETHYGTSTRGATESRDCPGGNEKERCHARGLVTRQRDQLAVSADAGRALAASGCGEPRRDGLLHCRWPRSGWKNTHHPHPEYRLDGIRGLPPWVGPGHEYPRSAHGRLPGLDPSWHHARYRRHVHGAILKRFWDQLLPGGKQCGRVAYLSGLCRSKEDQKTGSGTRWRRIPWLQSV